MQPLQGLSVDAFFTRFALTVFHRLFGFLLTPDSLNLVLHGNEPVPHSLAERKAMFNSRKPGFRTFNLTDGGSPPSEADPPDDDVDPEEHSLVA